ncbi:fluoride efflux transporter CrcB [Paenibacillus sp. N3/727]|uniref:fluoride efflux transporter CrcB n=1 Tax=Paenibacillus sp. N3/727 TaxID=2925845 RepID=UPI001F534F10|nr:fluoride efflux transporter CrcB [Paenibacillus sp. N3/727]UNK19890.1 fluoride efflux transporter CrcB [Paenibacillus sp. N3/727]
MGKNLLFVGAGGFGGTLLRYGLDEIIPAPLNGFPAAILFINLAGCLFLGWFLTYCLSSTHISTQVRLLIGTGFTGAFTTFSTFTVDTVRLIGNGQNAVAVIYVVISVVGGLLMSCIGVWLGRKMSSKQEGAAV